MWGGSGQTHVDGLCMMTARRCPSLWHEMGTFGEWLERHQHTLSSLATRLRYETGIPEPG